MRSPAVRLPSSEHFVAAGDKRRPAEVLVKLDLESDEEVVLLGVAEKEILASGGRGEVMRSLTSVAEREPELVLAWRSALDGAILRQFPDEEAGLELTSGEAGVLDVIVEVFSLGRGGAVRDHRGPSSEGLPYEFFELRLLHAAGPEEVK